MIPAWKAAVDAMLDLLVDDGALCLIDFARRLRPRVGVLRERRVYKAWFGLDGVYFNRDQVDYVARARTAPEYYAEARSRVPYRRGTRRAAARSSPAARKLHEVGSRPLTLFGFRSSFVVWLCTRPRYSPPGKSRLAGALQPAISLSPAYFCQSTKKAAHVGGRS